MKGDVVSEDGVLSLGRLGILCFFCFPLLFSPNFSTSSSCIFLALKGLAFFLVFWYTPLFLFFVLCRTISCFPFPALDWVFPTTFFGLKIQ